jgi:hypothetical protein
MIDEYLARSHVVKLIDNALGNDGKQKEKIVSRKRSRQEFVHDLEVNVMHGIIKELINSDLMPTLRTLLLSNFYITLAKNSDHDQFEEVCNIVVIFRKLIQEADSLYLRGDFEELRYFFLDKVASLLINSQQLLLIFHLTVKN